MERLTYFKDGYWRVNFSGVQYQADFEDATPDDAGSDCMTNWDHFSRRFTGIEGEPDNFCSWGATE